MGRKKKVQKPPFEDDLETLTNLDLEKKILDSSKKILEIETKKAQDEELNSLKEDVKVINAGYRDAKKHQQSIINFCLKALDERGKA